jgi:hypothetical protein
LVNDTYLSFRGIQQTWTTINQPLKRLQYSLKPINISTERTLIVLTEALLGHWTGIGRWQDMNVCPLKCCTVAIYGLSSNFKKFPGSLNTLVSLGWDVWHGLRESQLTMVPFRFTAIYGWALWRLLAHLVYTVGWNTNLMNERCCFHSILMSTSAHVKCK